MPDREAFADEIIGFHAQQAAGKALKAWDASLGQKHPFGHDLYGGRARKLLGAANMTAIDTVPDHETHLCGYQRLVYYCHQRDEMIEDIPLTEADNASHRNRSRD